MGFSKSFKKIAKAVVNPVGAGIEKLTGISQADQLKMGAGIGAGLFGGRQLGVFGSAATAGPYSPGSPPGPYAPGVDLARSSSGPSTSFNPWSFAAPVIGAGADIWSANKMASGQQEANATNLESAREQMRFQEHMSSTSHQREVADLRAAGLNPVLSANSGASTPVGASQSVDNAAVDVRGIVPKGLDSAVNLMKMNKEFEQADSSISLNYAAGDRESANAKVARNSALKIAQDTRASSASADIAEQARDYARKYPRVFSLGQLIKYFSPFASSARDLSSAAK